MMMVLGCDKDVTACAETCVECEHAIGLVVLSFTESTHVHAHAYVLFR